MASPTHASGEERAVYASAFALFDHDGSGRISASELGAVFSKLGRDPADAEALLLDVDPDKSGEITLDEFVAMMESVRGGGGGGGPSGEDDGDGEAADPKVLEFLRILDEYRVKCETEGNYLEAGRATEQLETLRKKEEKRQEKAMKARQLSERQDVQIAHNMQYAEFNAAWDKYLEEYDQMAQMYIEQMKQKHADALHKFQADLHDELSRKPPKFSRELLDWRRRQQILAKQRKYAEAEKIKKVADAMEAREKGKMEEQRLQLFQQRETKFRQQQQAELGALMKRIDGRRKEHVKQRALDSKRLLQRNRNVQSVLESKQTVEAERHKTEVRTVLAPPRSGYASKAALGTTSSSAKGSTRKPRKKKGARASAPAGDSIDSPERPTGSSGGKDDEEEEGELGELGDGQGAVEIDAGAAGADEEGEDYADDAEPETADGGEDGGENER